jgi:hypothetical protein
MDHADFDWLWESEAGSSMSHDRFVISQIQLWFLQHAGLLWGGKKVFWTPDERLNHRNLGHFWSILTMSGI